MKVLYTVVLMILIAFTSSCSTPSLIRTQQSLPKIYADTNATDEQKQDVTISLFRLNNYTDTPRAGLRASNILEGLLLSKGYVVTSHFSKKTPSMNKARKIAKGDASKYFIYGGVSEWRYKTGIDGEPAVSLQTSLYKTENSQLVWSATGADSDWGNASIGTTAQDLLLEMIEE